jgi:hypothetical protein
MWLQFYVCVCVYTNLFVFVYGAAQDKRLSEASWNRKMYLIKFLRMKSLTKCLERIDNKDTNGSNTGWAKSCLTEIFEI